MGEAVAAVHCSLRARAFDELGVGVGVPAMLVDVAERIAGVASCSRSRRLRGQSEIEACGACSGRLARTSRARAASSFALPRLDARIHSCVCVCASARAHC